MNILNQYIDLETNLGGVGQSNSWGGRLPPPTGPNGASVDSFVGGDKARNSVFLEGHG